MNLLLLTPATGPSGDLIRREELGKAQGLIEYCG